MPTTTPHEPDRQPTAQASQVTPGKYLDYLNDEGVIMGVLSAFCVALSAFSLERTAGAKDGALKALWASGPHWVLAGSAAALLASMFFYKQRSHLMWLYGQLALAEADPKAFCREDQTPGSVSEWLVEADGWKSWFFYRWGFGFLLVAMIEFAVALVRAFHPQSAWLSAMTPLGPPALVVPPLMVLTYAFHRFPFSDRPLKDLFWLLAARTASADG